MNNNYNTSQEYEINLLDFFWKLLMQWKAILIACIATAILVSGAKYLKDSKAYDASLAEIAEVEQEASLSEEEHIAKILESLPQEEASTLQYILDIQELLNKQKDYLNNSILLNTDPTNQRILNIQYYIQKDEVSDITVLTDAYNSYWLRTNIIDSLRDIIAPDSRLEFIYELISTYGGNITDSNADSTVFTINLILPDDVDKDAVIKVVDANNSSIKSELSSLLGKHRLSKINTEDYHTYSSSTADRHASVIFSVNNLNNTLTAAKANLSDEQNLALEAISTIENGLAPEGVPINRPAFSKRFAALGFVLGAILYAGIYLLVIIMRKCVSFASTAQSVSGVRLFGELYSIDSNKGIKSLLTSKVIATRRYKNKLDIDAQVESTASTIEAVCTHHGIKSLVLLTCGVTDDFQTIVDMLIKKCGSDGRNIKINAVDATKMDEKMLNGFSNAIFAVCNKTNIDSIRKISGLCNDYNVNVFGTVYTEIL